MLQIQEMFEHNACLRYKKLCNGGEKMVRLRRRWAKKMNRKLKGLRISGRRKLKWRAFFVAIWPRKFAKIYSVIVDRIMKIEGVYPGIVFSCQLGFPVLSHPTAKCRRNALCFQNRPPYSTSV